MDLQNSKLKDTNTFAIRFCEPTFSANQHFIKNIDVI